MSANLPKEAVIRHLLQSAMSNYAGRFVTVGSWLLLTPFVLQQLEPELFGLWVLVGSVMAYSSLLDFGIAGAVTKYVAEYRARGATAEVQSLVATSLALYCGLGGLVVAASLALAPLFPDVFGIAPEHRATAAWLVVVSGVGMGLSIPCAITSAVLRGLQRFDLLNLIGIIGTLLSAGGMVVVLLLGGGVIGVVVVSVAATLLMQIPSVWLIRRVAPEFRLGWRGASRKVVRTVTSFSSSLFLIHLGGQLETRTDEIVIGAFLPVSAITPYHLARKLSTLPQVLTEQFLSLILPLASELHAGNDQARLRLLYLVSTRLTLAIFLPVGASLIVLAGPILTLWVGAAYAEYAHIVLILTLASLIDTSQWPAGFVLQGMARHWFSALMAICSGVTNIALSVALVGSLGLTGVALATLIPTSVICLGLVLPYAMRAIGVDVREVVTQVFWPALLPAIPMTIVMYGLREALDGSPVLLLIAVPGVGLVVYLIGYLSMRSSVIERHIIRSFALSTRRFAEIHVGR